MTNPRNHSITYRDPGLVLVVVNALDADNREDLTPTTTELVASLDDTDAGDLTPDTRRKIIGELHRLGVIRHRLNRVGKTTGLEVTDLGRAWAGITTDPFPAVDDLADRWADHRITTVDTITTDHDAHADPLDAVPFDAATTGIPNDQGGIDLIAGDGRRVGPLRSGYDPAATTPRHPPSTHPPHPLEHPATP